MYYLFAKLIKLRKFLFIDYSFNLLFTIRLWIDEK